MVRSFYRLAGLLALVLWLGVLPALAVPVTQVMGGKVDGLLPLPPSGSCSGGVLTEVYLGTTNTLVSAATLAVYKSGSLENGFNGVGYAFATDAANNTNLVTFALETALPTQTSVTLKTTASVPDLPNQIRGNFYDPVAVSAGRFVVAGTQTVAPCNIVACVHWRSYRDAATISDVVTNALTASGAYIAYATTNGDSYWVAYTASAGGNTIEKFTTAFVSLGAIASTPNPYGDLTSDDTFIYSTVSIGGTYNIRRIDRVSLAVTDFPLFSTDTTVALFHTGGVLYAGNNTNSRIERVQTSTMTLLSSLALTATEGLVQGGMAFDAVNTRLYAVSALAGNTQYRRINTSTFTNEQTLAVVALAPQAFGIGFDFPHQNIYVATGGGGGNLQLSKVHLCS